jgi:hypothetical protein
MRAAEVVSFGNHDTVHPGRRVALASTCADAIPDGLSDVTTQKAAWEGQLLASKIASG